MKQNVVLSVLGRQSYMDQDPEERGFSAAVGAEDPDSLARGNGEGETVQYVAADLK